MSFDTAEFDNCEDFDDRFFILILKVQLNTRNDSGNKNGNVVIIAILFSNFL